MNDTTVDKIAKFFTDTHTYLGGNVCVEDIAFADCKELGDLGLAKVMRSLADTQLSTKTKCISCRYISGGDRGCLPLAMIFVENGGKNWPKLESFVMHGAQMCATDVAMLCSVFITHMPRVCKEDHSIMLMKMQCIDVGVCLKLYASAHKLRYGNKLRIEEGRKKGEAYPEISLAEAKQQTAKVPPSHRHTEREGVPHEGQIERADGSFYFGHILYGKANGYGKVWQTDGKTREGWWYDDQPIDTTSPHMAMLQKNIH
eukprot:GDKI01033047.1.p1 GENE.GDKI01033047.1~~GDKI01033047.1.p1  ORF type:complete len:265 (-),score=64.42 GDKI01033047.1:24-797(-)